MTDDILDNRPKRQADEAVEEWLKHNKPTVLQDFEHVAPKHKAKPAIDAKVRKKADAIVNRIRNEGLTYSRFSVQCGHSAQMMTQVKRAIKEQYGLKLTDVVKTTTTTKQVRVMELSR
ncbi:hypothetical protein LU290_03325 [Moraxella nasibovis]|uniref:hypothetical protein n=1 Tax=Moraxella nasibovis TaxID=2904120 RepID=UPI0024101EEE|nr:hypothetical protein [Moraxella nasibovis]WFF39267.1 hypothetical protein LU290_03325 [Moraxella nasibovis]